MTEQKIFVVYRESDAMNMIAFRDYTEATNYIVTDLKNDDDYCIDEIELR